ncbi:response regulator [Angustibacter sp. Root456]|uniref:response regulator n=1 Tax=Angustibacter sp. Root456 TaxID=1736539 RepID=UPI001F29547E|nr:response regulator [Angustibacter sp. Root456]
MTSSRQQPVRVLVVDDDFAVAAIHRRYVETLPGFAVVGEAHQGSDALRAIEEVRPDLVLLDIYLPDMSGVEVLRRLRAAPAGETIDVIAITASREVETVRAAMSGGVVHYLIKPFTLAALQERLMAYAAQRRELQQLVGGGVRDQADVDRLLSPGQRPARPAPDLPKGLSARTLQLVERALKDAGRELSAGEAAELCGLSRVSTRRYLEHLAARGLAEVKPRYGSAGRPEHGYRWVSGVR